MPGAIRSQERAPIVLVSSGAAFSTNSAILVGTDIDARGSGNAERDFFAQFSFVCQWASVSGITVGSVAAELYLIPSVNGTDFADVNLSAGASRIPYSAFVGVFEMPIVPGVNSNLRMVSRSIDLLPYLYRPYLLNKSGQTISAGWSLVVGTSQLQYT